ncbi:extracellular solute-binding protein [Caldalkalibacillus thermarum TA2.A1]|uniref:Extracellular solute-binding protein n=2 Tax=Caldalkalibacillus TaxID=379065 RepID=A0A8X8LA89_CALTT|nr:extracellular solute-binding protein [Caldalkalibacillus thermarum]QZT33813.1 extracellular solute-binding protein [Caldalkalibacillus thermarum TA2.A1]
MKKGFSMKGFRLFAVLALMLALAACGAANDQEGQEGEEDAKAGGDVLRVVMGLGETEWEVMRSEIFPAFEEEHGVKIDAVQAEAEDVVDRLDAQVRAGRVEYDLITQDVNALYGLVDRDLVEDLSEYRDIIPDEVFEAMVEVGTFDDRLLFLPYRPNVEITFYNEARFKEAGLEVPKTWDELLEVAKTFHEQDGVGRVAIKANLEGDQVLHIFDFIRSAGGDPYVLNDEGSVKAFEFLQELAPYLAPDSRTANWNTMNTYLANESVYLGKNWPFGINVIVEQGGKEEIKAYSGWSGSAGMSHALGGEVIGIPKGAPNKELAIEFAKYLMSKEVQEKLVRHLAWPPVRSDAYGEVEEWKKPYFEAISEALENADPRGNVPYWPEVERAILDAYQDIVIDGQDVKSTLDRYAEQIEQARQAAE